MKLDRWHPLAFGLLAIALAGSISLNYVLFTQSGQYYSQLNGLRLDPLGLSHYNTKPDQSDLVRPDMKTVVLFGDSRVAHWALPDLDGVEFVNRGISAETSAQALLRFDYHVTPLTPDIIVVQVGINDLKTIPVFPEQKEALVANCQENIRQIARKSTELGAKVILTTVFPTGPVPLHRRPYWSEDVALAVKDVNEFIRSLSTDDILIFDSYSVLTADDGNTQSDFSRDLLHLNEAGYQRLNESFLPVLIELARD